MRKRLFFCVLFAVSTAIGQQTPTTSFHTVVECKTSYLRACVSFNEMVEKGDKDILRALELHQHSLACFRTDEDVFVLISFSDPKPEYYRKSPLTSHYVQQDGDLEFSKYNQGVHEASVSASGLWAKRAGQDDATATFSTPEKVEPNANIDDSEISFKYRFQNQSKTQTRYIIQIRRSTLRFVEHFQWDGLNAPRKSDSLSSGTSTSDGYCVQIN